MIHIYKDQRSYSWPLILSVIQEIKNKSIFIQIFYLAPKYIMLSLQTNFILILLDVAVMII